MIIRPVQKKIATPYRIHMLSLGLLFRNADRVIKMLISWSDKGVFLHLSVHNINGVPRGGFWGVQLQPLPRNSEVLIKSTRTAN